MKKEIPSELKDHILAFDWDVKEVWALNAKIQKVERSTFDYLLRLPLWSSLPEQGMLFDISPLEVLRDPSCSPHQLERIEKADPSFPIDMLEWRGRKWVLDGVHRLAKLYRDEVPSLEIRVHTYSAINQLSKTGMPLSSAGGGGNKRIHFARAEACDAERLTELGLESKAYWGYDQKLLDCWKPMFEITEKDIGTYSIWKAQAEGEIIGFFSLDRRKRVLDDFFLAPAYIGKGIGKLMFQKFREVMQAEGVPSVKIVSDPNAQGFYEKRGAVKIGEKESIPKGRFLPVLEYDIQ